MKIFVLALTVIVFSLGSITAAQTAPPGFAVKFSDGAFREYRTNTINDEQLSATVTDRDDNQWELTIKPKGQAINEVWFPYEAAAEPLGPANGGADDLIYYPLLAGFVYENSGATGWKTDGPRNAAEPCYPGDCFAPLVILADESGARMLAAANWPPRPVTPIWQAGRLALKYKTSIAANTSQTYSAFIVKTAADAARGYRPWQSATDVYKNWLKQKMTAAGLYPLPYPDWLKRAHGFLHAVLSQPEYDIEILKTKWEKWKTYFPWIQFWGQMNRTVDNCCSLNRTIDPGYLPELLDFVDTVRQSGGHISFYSRPFRPGDGANYPPLDSTVPIPAPDTRTMETPLNFIRSWIEKNRVNYRADGYYLDVVGAVYLGDPLFVANLFKNGTFPAGSFIEGPVDIYPTAYLLGGSFWGGANRRGGPGITPEEVVSNPLLAEAAFPALSRYLLDDRIMFSGVSNGDYYFWGSVEDGAYTFFDRWRDRNRSCIPGYWPTGLGYKCEPHWLERQTFLLGAKFDIESPADNPRSDVMNPAVRLTISERDRVNWWAREPRYLDTKGLTEVPTGMDIRRFIDYNGVTFLAIDNWLAAPSVNLKVEGQSVNINAPIDQLTGQPRQLFIYEMSIAPPAPPDSIPPSTIADLKLTDIYPNGQAGLNWRAPYEDKDDPASGPAASYDIRYDVKPLTDSVWSRAAQAADEPLPHAPGTVEIYFLPGLTPGQTYYAAMRSQDAAGNFSALSNNLLIAMPEPLIANPIIPVSPLPIPPPPVQTPPAGAPAAVTSDAARIAVLRARLLELIKTLLELLRQRLEQLLILRGWR